MGIPILFLHGWTMTGSTFNQVRTQLEPDFPCITPDLPGHGVLAGVNAGLAPSVRLVQDWLRELDRPLLVGWSMGAAVAWQYISLHGCAQLRGLVTIDMSPKILPDPNWPYGLRGQTADTVRASGEKFRRDWPRAARGITRNMFAEPCDAQVDADKDARLEQLLTQNPQRLCPVWDDMVAADQRHIIGQITVPYLVLNGAQSRLYDPAMSNWIETQAPKAQRHEFRHSGHSPHLEEPEAFVAALRQFLLTL